MTNSSKLPFNTELALAGKQAPAVRGAARLTLQASAEEPRRAHVVMDVVVRVLAVIVLAELAFVFWRLA